MLSALALAIVAQTPAPSDLERFYPLKPGMQWTYVTLPEGTETQDTVLPIAQVAGEDAIPVLTRFRGKKVGTTYYRVSEGTVWAVAFDREIPPSREAGEFAPYEWKLVPIQDPHPIFRLGTGRTKWDYKGFTPMGLNTAPFEFSSTSSRLPKKRLYGEERDLVEVTMEATLDGGTPAMVKIKQTTQYASGIGMIQMEEDSTQGKTKTKRTVKLLDFKLPD